MSGRRQKLTPRFEQLIQNALTDSAPSAIAQDILQLSNFYLEHPGQATPWKQDFALRATLAYFMPLNFARMMSVLRELERFVPAEDIQEVWDFGSGLGTTHWALEEQTWLSEKPFFISEMAREACMAHERLAEKYQGRWAPAKAEGRKPGKGALAIFSYSFLEMQNVLPSMHGFDHVLILEPSTRDCGRALMQWRQKFISTGLMPLAPCTHSLDCPLLVHSAKDWCHERIHFDPPEWWTAIEEHLPMRNRTITYSYLLSSRVTHDAKWRGATRVIGDTLEERGKTRQLICRGPAREFASWLHKKGNPPKIPNGSLIQELHESDQKNGEVRADFNLHWVE